MKTVLLAHNTPEKIVNEIKDHGFNTVIMPKMDDMAEPVSSHPDMLLFVGFGRLFVRSCHLKDERFAAVTEEILELTEGLILSPTSDTASDKYPFDIAFNCLNLRGKGIFGKADFLSGAVKRAGTEAGLPVLDVAQGYAKCSTTVIDDGESLAVITADPSIYKAVTDVGVHAVKIAAGAVTLPGYDTGFIGGASFFHNNTIYFLGDVKTHPNCDIIEKTAEKMGKSIVSLTELPLFDAGCLII